VPEPRTGKIHLLNGLGAAVGQVAATPGEFQRPTLAADDSGAIYTLRYPFTLVKYGPSGQVDWTRVSDVPLRAVFVLGKGSAQRIGVVLRDAPTARTFTPAGQPAGNVPIAGDAFTRSSSGGLVGIDGGRYVRIFDAGGNEMLSVGDSRHDEPADRVGAPLSFYILGGAAQLPDGRLLITDVRRGLIVLSSEGLTLGEIAPTELDPLGLADRSGVLVQGNQVFLVGGKPFSNEQYLVRIPLQEVLERAATRSVKDHRLGIGAGLLTTADHHYFAADSEIVVEAAFDPWWRGLADGSSLCWSLRDLDQVRTGERGLGANVPLAQLVGRTPLDLPRRLPAGAYQVDATLLRAGQAVSKTALVFTVAAPGMRLNLGALPGGADWGGPAAPRALALADQLGTGAHRAQIDWSRVLKQGLAGPLDVSDYTTSFRDAAAEAKWRGVPFVVQVGAGGIEKSLVEAGNWERRVEELVAALAPHVDVWEAWNEPNATYGPAGEYVSKVLAPFTRAVRRADPGAKVIGGSTVSVHLGYWKGILAADGLRWMDIAGVHPYTGHNRSWEEDGTVAQLRELRLLLGPFPIWNTEHAWWSNGSANLLRQADNSARAMLWMRAFGIERWAYFIAEGGWGDHNASFSAIQYKDAVKPTALAIMTASSKLAGRPFLGEVDLGFPSAYALRFGPREGDPGGGELVAAWTDGFTLPVVATSTKARDVVVTRSLGRAATHTVGAGTPFELDSDPLYFELRGPGSLHVQSHETAGADLALKTAGATAAASSATPTNPGSAAIDGVNGANGGADLPGLPMWVSAPGDDRPSIVVTLKGQPLVNRVLVATHSLGNTVPGLRDYDVEVRASSSAPWRTVAEVRGQFHHRQRLVAFPPTPVSQVRVSVLKVNYGGYNEGERHAGWQLDQASLADPRRHWYGPAVVAELAAFAPGTVSPVASETDVSPGTTTAPRRPVTAPAPKSARPDPPTAAKPSPATGARRTVPVRSTRVVAVALPPARARLGVRFWLRGTVRPGATTRVAVQRLTASGWRQIQVGRTTRQGRFALAVTLRTRGTHRLRVTARATDRFVWSRSAPVGVVVR
jgi:hypothetical protein